jgi:hypothetical protein
MVVSAVRYEPVSVCQFPGNRELTGNFARLGGPRGRVLPAEF